jgi:phosphate transport system protein
MALHLQRQIDRLKRMILKVGALAEESVEAAIRAVEQRDPVLARRVIQDDNKVDAMEIDVEEECLHTLACDQPVAQDLRFVVSVLKINSDLERIADLAVNIAQQAIFLSEEAKLDNPPLDTSSMAAKVRSMLKRALDALVNIDLEMANSVRQTDDVVDRMHREAYDAVAAAIRQQPHRAEQILHYLSISRQLERIADHTTNIAEDVVYMATGAIPRHRHQGQNSNGTGNAEPRAAR